MQDAAPGFPLSLPVVGTLDPSAPAPRRRRWGREILAWGVIGLIALGAMFVQTCPDHLGIDGQAGASAWPPTSVWDAIYQCPIHQAFLVSNRADPDRPS